MNTIEPDCTCTYWYEKTAHVGADLLCGEPSPLCPIHGHLAKQPDPDGGIDLTDGEADAFMKHLKD